MPTTFRWAYCIVLATLAAALVAAPARADWRSVTGAGPGARSAASMAFDAARGGSVLFGGSEGGRASGETWTFDGARWARKSPQQSPPPSHGSGMAFDAARGNAVLYGGVVAPAGAGTPAFSGATWTWDGTTWALAAQSGPPPRALPAMAYDPVRQEVVLFGGVATASNVAIGSAPSTGPDPGVLGDTWVWDGSSWTRRMPAASPSPRFGASLALGPDGRLVLFGGSDRSSSSDETWSWDGETWRRLETATAPEPRHAGAMAHDSARGVTVLAGGLDMERALSGADGAYHQDTWLLDAAGWKRHAAAGGPRAAAAMAFDAARAQTVLFGGVFEDRYLGDTWTSGAFGAEAAAPVVEATAPPAATPAAPCAPARAVPQRVRLGRRGSAIAGTATPGCGTPGIDGAAAGDLRHVEVSIARRAGGRCRPVSRTGRLLPARACAKRIWLQARGTERWSLRLRRALPAGRYLTSARAVTGSGAGPASRALATRRR